MIIDVSQFQGVIDWEKAKPQIEGAIIRIGYRGYGSGKISYDPQYKRNRSVVERLGIPHSFYFFPTSVTDAEAEEEAEFIRNEVSGAELAYPVYLDSESCSPKHNKRSDLLSREDRTRMLKIILDTLKESGISAGVYASTSWLENSIYMGELADYPVWVAQYAKACTYSGAYSLWQYTSDGHVDGIQGRVDCSVKVGDPGQATGEAPQTTAPLESVDEVAMEVLNGAWGAGDDRRNRLTSAGYDYQAVQSKVNELLKPKKTIDQIAQEVISGQWGTGDDRKNRLTAAGYDYNSVQAKVNELCKPRTPVKSTDDIAREVIAGKWGVDPGRSQKLRAAGYDPAVIQSRVNALLGASSKPAGKSIDAVAREVIAGKWGTDPARRQKLTAAGYDAAAVQKRVNELMR